MDSDGTAVLAGDVPRPVLDVLVALNDLPRKRLTDGEDPHD
jgi:hypothetical protein